MTAQETQGKATNSHNTNNKETNNTKLLRRMAGALSESMEIQRSTPTKQSVLSYTPQYIQQLPAIEKLLLHLEGKGRSPRTILAYKKSLKALALRANLNDTTETELAIARYKGKNDRPITNNYKSKLCDCYATYCKFNKIIWEKPIYTPEPTTIQPPTKEKVAVLVSSARGSLSIKIDIISQTGLRPIEIQGEKGLRASNMHTDTKTITARITKGCNPRPPLPITEQLNTRLRDYITKHNLRPDDILFTGSERRFGETFRRYRNRLAEKLNDPTIRTIRLYDLRHYYCTTQLRRTQNTETVRILMGHKQLNTKIPTLTQWRKRRMDSRRNNRQRTSQTTLRSRLHIPTNSTRRDNAIPKTQINTNPPFLFNIMLNHYVALASRSRSNSQKLKTTTQTILQR